MQNQGQIQDAIADARSYANSPGSSFKLNKLAFQVKWYLARAGAPGTLVTVESGKVNLSTDQKADTVYTDAVSVLLETHRSRYPVGSEVLDADEMVIIEAYGLTKQPKAGSTLKFGGKDREITAVETFKPDGITPVFHTLGLKS